jgi:serine phosphatase RsbU (regulator of sigma subunit)
MKTDEMDDFRTAEELRNFQEIARRLKPSPGEVPRLDGMEIDGVTLPLNGVVGGDHIIWIDFKERYDLEGRIADAEREGKTEVVEELRRNKHRAGILLADVSGHRITDAMIAAMLHQAFLLGVNYELDRHGEVTTQLFEHINARFFKTSAINKFLTMIYGEISDRGRFRFISAGHHPPLVFSREFGRFMPISRDRLVSFPPVGVFPSVDDMDERRRTNLFGYKKRYEVNEINLLAPGDILLLSTDGLAEHAGGRYFPEGPERCLRELREASAAEICRGLQADLLQQGKPEDDVSFVVIKKRGQT